MKKRLSLLLASAMICSTLASCSSSDTGTGSGSTGSGSTPQPLEELDLSIYTPNGEYPVVQPDQDIVITAFGPLRGTVTTYDSPTNLTTVWFEELTGITVKVETALTADLSQKFNTIMTGGDLPDIFLNNPGLSEQLLYGEQGSFIRLNELIDEYMPNLQAALELNPSVVDTMAMADGTIYALPQIGDSNSHGQTPYRMWINQEWLDNLGLDMPTTTDEFYEVLKAFKEQDANGNGDPNDEVPLSGTTVGWNNDPIAFLMNAFTTYSPVGSGGVGGMYVDDNGTVIYPRVTDEWREGLAYMNKLYEEGLYDPMALSQTANDLKALGSSPDAAKIGACAGGTIVGFVDSTMEDRWRQYYAVEPLIGPDGYQNAIYNPTFAVAALMITDKCEYPEAVCRAWDVMYTLDGFLHNCVGVEGIDYNISEEGAVGYLGDPAVIDLIRSVGSVGDNSWQQLGPWYQAPMLYEALDNVGGRLWDESYNKYFQHKLDYDNVLPPMAMSEEQSRTVVDVSSPMDAYLGTATAEFIMGTRDIASDADWEKYLSDMESFGLSSYVQVYQDVYDSRV